MIKTLTILMSAALLALTTAACSGGPSDEFCSAYSEFEETGTEAEGDLTQVMDPLGDMLEAADEDVQSDIEVVRDAFQEVIDTGEVAVLESEEVTESIDDVDAYAGGC